MSAKISRILGAVWRFLILPSIKYVVVGAIFLAIMATLITCSMPPITGICLIILIMFAIPEELVGSDTRDINEQFWKEPPSFNKFAKAMAEPVSPKAGEGAISLSADTSDISGSISLAEEGKISLHHTKDPT